MRNLPSLHEEGRVDKTKPTGITIDAIHLLDCRVGDLNPDAKLEFHLALTDLVRRRSESDDTLTVLASFDLMHKIDTPSCRFLCRYLAQYGRKEDACMTWEEFSDVMCVNHIIPYLREFVASVTLRMPLRELLLEPTNVHLLVDEFHAHESQTRGEKELEKQKEQQ